uniref:ShKT domain-containing protein n=2 Tax=Caenorhabditis japonica TaxID=281687 RepID=A0A8R1EK26_CAEJA
MSAAGGAHSGPAFLPWHREFVKRVEFALRQVDPSVNLPYWDSTLDSGLPRAADTILFSEYLMGGSSAQGLVNSGPFVNWQTLSGRAQIQRAVGAQGAPLSQNDIDFVMRQTQIDQVLSFTAPQQGCPYRTDFNCLEYTHGNVHIFVGGDMFDTATSSNDPSFFLHHSFIDFVWEQWRLAKQSRADREIAYPPDNQLCASPQHFGASPMQPFSPMRNIDGLSNKYTDNLYSFAPKPTCTAGGDCGSKFLFCDTSSGAARCVSRIKPGSSCAQFRVNPCFAGSTAPPPTVAPVTPAPSTPNPIQSQESCFNENQCCATWAASGECQRNTAYMNEWCKASCGVCKPKYRLADGMYINRSSFYHFSSFSPPTFFFQIAPIVTLNALDGREVASAQRTPFG